MPSYTPRTFTPGHRRQQPSLRRARGTRLTRRVQRILKELLLWWALPGERKGNWASSIIEERARLETIVEDSPSLQAQLGEVVAREYRWARSKAQDQTTAYVFPEACPFTAAQVLDLDFFPEGATLEPTTP